MHRWTNWSSKLHAQPAAIHHVRSEDDAVALAVAARDDGSSIRCVGTAHSHAPLVPTPDTIADVSALSGVISMDAETRRAWVRAGTPISALGRPLQDGGLALENQGDIDRRTLAGAVATGTHGTGVSLSNLSSAVVGARLAVSTGDLLTCSVDDQHELWQVTRQNLGAIGIVTAIEIQLRDAYRLRQQGWNEPLDDMLSRLDEIVHHHRHFEFFWFPTADMVVAKATDETDDDPEYPVGEEGSRCAWNHEVLSNHRDWPHTEMEYSIPLEAGPPCLADLREMLRTDFPEMGWPVEYRTLAADDVWLSTAYRRRSATISIHADVETNEVLLFEACEKIFVQHDGRPHWGKVHYRRGDELATTHPRWDDWWRVRDATDPTGTFVNEHLDELRNRSTHD